VDKRTRNIVLVGFSGAGKSTVGRMLASRLGWAVVDTDAEIERRAGKSIAAIFAEDGEPAFRALEAAVCQQASEGDRKVIATGGGALCNDDTKRAMQATGHVVLLDVSEEEALRRLAAHTDRPLLAGEDAAAKLRALYRSRATFYGQFEQRVKVDGKTPDQVVDAIVTDIQRPAGAHQDR